MRASKNYMIDLSDLCIITGTTVASEYPTSITRAFETPNENVANRCDGAKSTDGASKASNSTRATAFRCDVRVKILSTITIRRSLATVSKYLTSVR
ncbi:Uncharacterized protein BM_BM17449 [Brugia malayi]|uniref:Uncharacterized protein n=1 Tax=Brugia malayi TaxID=6279 RepID=A0A4E9F7V8_BRUMA|nr:Uncharacterized protein BM_BM17449 [Brugia malayi]VIO92890.1 Uncharacterized protein BM_BM17449 [Brugia malayi]